MSHRLAVAGTATGVVLLADVPSAAKRHVALPFGGSIAAGAKHCGIPGITKSNGATCVIEILPPRVRGHYGGGIDYQGVAGVSGATEGSEEPSTRPRSTTRSPTARSTGSGLGGPARYPPGQFAAATSRPSCTTRFATTFLEAFGNWARWSTRNSKLGLLYEATAFDFNKASCSSCHEMPFGQVPRRRVPR